MSRVILAVALVLVLLVSTAHADRAPSFAVDLRGTDKLADAMAVAMENALRKLGSAKGARYRAKGTRKDRVAASSDACPSAQTTTCAAEIGARLGVDYMLAGEIERRGRRYVITINVTNVTKQQRVRSVRDQATSKTTATQWAKRVFDRVVDSATGSLTITSNAARGVILIDGAPATELVQGRASISGLGLGTHAIEVRADGYKSFADDVDVDGDNTMNVLLERAPGK